jgi:hypothetical protein
VLLPKDLKWPMRILFDNGTPEGLLRCLTGHVVTLARDAGWERLTNGKLLHVAEQDGFDLLLTTDKNILYQQNLRGRKIARVVLGNQNWNVARLHVDKIVAAVNACTPGSYTEVAIPFR